MKKIAGLYRSFLNEQDEQFQEYRTGGEKLEELQKLKRDVGDGVNPTAK